MPGLFVLLFALALHCMVKSDPGGIVPFPSFLSSLNDKGGKCMTPGGVSHDS
jgi:hypothetical protein